MIKFLKSIVILSVILVRCYFIYQVIKGLYFNYLNPEYPLDNIQWYVYALILDLYIVKIVDNSDSNDIYSKKNDE
jgi:hypothetical protein